MNSQVGTRRQFGHQPISVPLSSPALSSLDVNRPRPNSSDISQCKLYAAPASLVTMTTINTGTQNRNNDSASPASGNIYEKKNKRTITTVTTATKQNSLLSSSLISSVAHSGHSTPSYKSSRTITPVGILKRHSSYSSGSPNESAGPASVLPPTSQLSHGERQQCSSLPRSARHYDAVDTYNDEDSNSESSFEEEDVHHYCLSQQNTRVEEVPRRSQPTSTAPSVQRHGGTRIVSLTPAAARHLVPEVLYAWQSPPLIPLPSGWPTDDEHAPITSSSSTSFPAWAGCSGSIHVYFLQMMALSGVTLRNSPALVSHFLSDEYPQLLTCLQAFHFGVFLVQYKTIVPPQSSRSSTSSSAATIRSGAYLLNALSDFSLTVAGGNEPPHERFFQIRSLPYTHRSQVIPWLCWSLHRNSTQALDAIPLVNIVAVTAGLNTWTLQRHCLGKIGVFGGDEGVRVVGVERMRGPYVGKNRSELLSCGAFSIWVTLGANLNGGNSLLRTIDLCAADPMVFAVCMTLFTEVARLNAALDPSGSVATLQNRIRYLKQEGQLAPITRYEAGKGRGGIGGGTVSIQAIYQD